MILCRKNISINIHNNVLSLSIYTEYYKLQIL